VVKIIKDRFMKNLTQNMPWIIPLLISILGFGFYIHLAAVKVDYIEIKINALEQSTRINHEHLLLLEYKNSKLESLCCSEIKDIEK